MFFIKMFEKFARNIFKKNLSIFQQVKLCMKETIWINSLYSWKFFLKVKNSTQMCNVGFY